MKRFLFFALAVGFLGLLFYTQERPALADKDDGEPGEQEIAIKDLPGPIKKALSDLKVGQIAEVERDKTKSGATVYEIELRVGKQEVELKLDAKGTLLRIEIEEQDDDDDDAGAGGEERDDD